MIFRGTRRLARDLGTKAVAAAAFDAFSESYSLEYEKASDCLAKDRDGLLAFYEFPAEHWKHLRTTNPIESTFATVRHRTVRSKSCLSKKTALAMVFKLVGGAEILAPPRWPQPVAETDPGCDVRRRAGGRRHGDPLARNRRRLTGPAVTKNWR